MYTVTLNGGKELTNLTLNGNNFISPDIIDPEVFTTEALSHVTFSGDGPFELPESADNLVLVQCIPWIEGGSAFILREVTEEEKKEAARTQEITSLELALCEVYEALMGGAM